MKAYLLFYNLVCAIGWAHCVAKGVAGLRDGVAPADLYEDIRDVLVLVQTLMLMEILHSLVGMVRSPVVTVFIQVMSRIFIIWGQTDPSTDAQAHWSLYLIVLSWGVTEVVRYLFYFFSLIGDVPYPLFWLRYSLFMALYPTGISGEILQTLAASTYWQTANPVWHRMSLVTLIMYVPGSPGMIGNMWKNRCKAFKKRSEAGKPARPLAGVVWPLDKKGGRSTTNTSKSIIAAANAGGGAEGQALATKVEKERKWRFGYVKHMLNHVKLCLSSEETALSMARAGLAKAQNTFMFVRDGEEMTLAEAMQRFGSAHPYETAEIKGKKAMPSKLEVYLNYGAKVGEPYAKFKDARANKLTGLALREQLDAWVEHGCIEADVADAIKLVQQHQGEWLDLRNHYFVLLGASSAMGPLYYLLSLGANIICVDLDRDFIWNKLFAAVEDSPGRIIFPVAKGTDWQGMVAKGDLGELAKVSGSNLMTATPEISAWLNTVCPGKQLVAGAYVYLMGALFPQITMACDVVIESLCKARPDTAIASLCTPTDAHVATPEAVEAATANYKKAPLWQKLFEACGLLKRNKHIEAAGGLKFVNGIVPDQGPNYIMSKRIQHWRAMVARAEGHVVSSNVAPSTATASVTQNKSFAAAYSRMHLFGAMEVVYQELSLSAMGVLLIHDLRNPKSAANPKVKLAHPLCLVQATAWHGGVNQCPYTISTIGIPSAAIYYFSKFFPNIVGGILGMLATAQYVKHGVLPVPVVKLLEALPEDATAPITDAVASVAEALQL